MDVLVLGTRKMEFSDCARILNDRKGLRDGACLCCSQLDSASAPETESNSDSDALAELNVESLIDTLLALQSDRVQTYRTFNETKNLLIDELRIAEYPILCGEVTSRFSAISSQITKIHKLIISKGNDEVGVLINKLQQQEKEKLTLVAASHLDDIQLHFPHLKIQGGGEGVVVQCSADSISYTNNQITAIESVVTDILEEIRAILCDL